VPPRILFVGNYLEHASRQVSADLAAGLRARGHQLTLTSAQRRQLPRLLAMVTQAVRRRRAYDVAVIDVYSGRAFIYAEVVSAVLRALGKPYVLTLHGGNLPAFGRKWPTRVRRLLDSAAAVTVPSAYLLDQMCPYRSDLRVIPNGLDVSRYQFRLRARPGPQVLWLRAFHRVYNPALAPAAIARLIGEFPQLRLTMVGPDKGDGSLQDTRDVAARLGVLDRLVLPGSIEKAEVPRWMAESDIFVNTPDIDNAPVSVLEAMAKGLCIVSTRVGGLPYLLEHEQDALLVPAGDPEALATAVRRVLMEPGLGARLSANARRKAEQHDWGLVVPQWTALLTWAARGSAP
jgi:glycosyltransferase involved in cell wall biosynthesis